MGLVRTPMDTLTYKVNGLAMQVQSELKPGHRERVYQQRLADLCVAAGLETEIEKRIDVFVGDSLVGYMYLDLWIERALVVECKAFPHQLTNDEVGQLITYLAATGSPVGIAYNFGRQKLEFRRILPPKNVQEWHKHLYRCIWTPPGRSLPPLDSVTPSTPIRFSVVSRFASPPSSVPVSSPAPPSAPTRSSVSPPLESPSVPSVLIRLPWHSPPGQVSASRAAQSVVGPPSTYASSGVSIDSGNRAVELMRDAVRSTYGPEVLAGIGAFGGLFDASALKGMKDPVLVASTDGVGTKVKLAAQAGRYESIGHDIVNHCIDDILVQGARPLFFLDYIASSKLNPEMAAAVVSGIAAACREAGCALLGGETAEMPGVYAEGEFDVAGTIVGIVERAALLPRSDLRPGDVLLGLRASGPHTNGYSLIRKVFEDVPLDAVLPELGLPLADALLAPHRSYLSTLQSLISNPSSPIKALAHLTGGAFLENIPRVLPDGLGATVRLGSWPVPPLFQLIQRRGGISTEEMHRVFNMGIGMIAVIAPEHVHAVQSAIPEETWPIGELVPGEKKVTLA